MPAVLPMVEQVCSFHEKLDPAKYGFLPDPAEMYRGWLTSRARDARSVFLVADVSRDEQAHLVGFLIGTIEREIPIYRIDEFGFIHDLWVEENYRHEGVGRQLVSAAIERFGELGVPQVRLDVAYHNDPARGLFQTCGFRPTVIEMVHEFRAS
ncbi:MAG TPA: GNAT family N-acetyltransferase [Bradyrhizobium sp.]